MGNKWDMEAIRDVAKRGLVVNIDTNDPAAAPAAPESKFHNKQVIIDGIKFPSKLEGNRYMQLKMMRANGLINDFRRQVDFPLEVNGVHITTYRADFVVEYPDGTTVVEDTKGVITEVFRLKKLLMKAVHGIEIYLISNSNNNGKVKKSKRRKR